MGDVAMARVSQALSKPRKMRFPGRLHETMVVGEILKWMRTNRDDGEQYSYRTRSGMEIERLDTSSSQVYKKVCTKVYMEVYHENEYRSG